MKRLALLALVLVVVVTASRALAQNSVPVIGSATAEGAHRYNGLTLFTVSVNWATASTPRYLMVFDSTTLPTNGSTTSCSAGYMNGCLRWCGFMPNSTLAPAMQSYDWTVHPLPTMFGVALAVSTGTSCGTLTIDGNNDYFYAQVK
ncbi:MAG TPA: hypothetical protein VH187_01685 [Scandinavium sp.]|jgi:hypothetical protein|uniref:hypothetical protein n=1 Tax=Scandinavium sp. TaxID=2830653 RepID=UPI002E37906A|nr:hypothetical protein [Scandinavium sp.]HEX4499870.1 hypothetical protein [Scandinavium sp.]